jgi:hypothetical protein
MFDLDEIEDKELVIAPKLEGLENELEARTKMMDSLSDIARFKPDEWELEKLAILRLGIITEAKLDKIRKLSRKNIIAESEDEAKAKEKLGRVFSINSGKGFAYLILEDKDLRPIPQQEMTPVIKMLAGDDQMKESQVYEHLHSKRKIDKMTTHIMPHGRNHYSVDKLENGKFEAICHVSVGEMLSQQLKRTAAYEIDPRFEKMVWKHYKYMIEIYEYALAIKFAFDKTNCIWLREHSDTGKTFFLGAIESKDYVFITDGAIKENDFVGDGPDRWGKMLYFYIDEATKFSSDMKTAYLAYRMNYGGRVELDMPLRILASDNEITDLTNGVDQQIENRIINIHYQGKMNLRKWLDENEIDATTAQIMWQKIILKHILELLEQWGKSDSLQSEASKKITEFKKKYKKSKMAGLDETARGLFCDLLSDICNEDGAIKRSFGNGRRDFSELIIKDNDSYLIKSPKTFMNMLFDEYMPEKKKAFFKKYPNNEAISKIFGSDYKNRRHDLGQCKAICTQLKPVFDEGR